MNVFQISYKKYYKKFSVVKRDNVLEWFGSIVKVLNYDDNRVGLFVSAFLNRVFELGIDKIIIDRDYIFLRKEYNFYKLKGKVIVKKCKEIGPLSCFGMDGGMVIIEKCGSIGYECCRKMRKGKFIVNKCKTIFTGLGKEMLGGEIVIDEVGEIRGFFGGKMKKGKIIVNNFGIINKRMEKYVKRDKIVVIK